MVEVLSGEGGDFDDVHVESFAEVSVVGDEFFGFFVVDFVDDEEFWLGDAFDEFVGLFFFVADFSCGVDEVDDEFDILKRGFCEIEEFFR